MTSSGGFAGAPCIVFGRANNPALSNFVARLNQKVMQISPETESVATDFSDLAEYWTPEGLAKPVDSGDRSKDPHQVRSDTLRSLVSALARATYFVVDLDVDREMGQFLLGAREALTSNLTFAVSQNSSPPNWPSALEPVYIDVSEPDWKLVDRKLRSFFPPTVTSTWPNGFRESRAVKVSAPATTLRMDGSIVGRSSKNSSPAKRLIEYWRLGVDGDAPKVGLTFGGIEDVRGFPVWFNSENVDMQMGRVVDKFVSSIIRARGANWTGLEDRISDDAMFVELSRQMGARPRLNFGDAIATRVDPDCKLATENKVGCVVHVATVRPAGVGAGYSAAGSMGTCLRQAFDVLHDHAVQQGETKRLDKVVFPLFGAGDGGLAPVISAAQMVSGLRQWMEERGRSRTVKEALFIAREQDVAEAIRKAFLAHGFKPKHENPAEVIPEGPRES